MSAPKFYRWNDGDLILRLHVQPRASRNELAGPHGDALKVRIVAPPIDGKANDQLAAFLADEFNVPRTAVKLLAGATGRRKTFRIRKPARLPRGIETG